MRQWAEILHRPTCWDTFYRKGWRATHRKQSTQRVTAYLQELENQKHAPTMGVGKHSPPLKTDPITCNTIAETHNANPITTVPKAW